MSAAATKLWLELAGKGIELEAVGNTLRYYPRDKMTPELLARTRALKLDLLVLFREPTKEPDAVETKDARAIEACPKCGSLEQWEAVAGDAFGHTAGGWHCLTCNPPSVASKLRNAAAKLARGAVPPKTNYQSEPKQTEKSCAKPMPAFR